MINITLNESARQLFRTGTLGLPIFEAFAAVIDELGGNGALLQRHFDAGHPEWPRLPRKWLTDERKFRSPGARTKFLLPGRVHRAITQASLAGTLHAFGSSTELREGATQVQYTSRGVYVR